MDCSTPEADDDASITPVRAVCDCGFHRMSGVMHRMKKVCALLLWGVPVLAVAQVNAPAAGPSAVVRCESKESRRVHCPMDAARGVQLVRQLSDHACIREEGWGVDDNGIWVDRGCRAEFALLHPPVSRKVTRRVVRCESRGRTERCPVLLRDAAVRLLRQQSALPCKEGRTWGYGRNEVWVSRGCKGQFEVAAEDGSGFVDAPRQVTCESKERLRRECGVTVERRVTLVKQLSSAPCEEGASWGWDRTGVWVDEGCRAQFSVD